MDMGFPLIRDYMCFVMLRRAPFSDSGSHHWKHGSRMKLPQSRLQLEAQELGFGVAVIVELEQ